MKQNQRKQPKLPDLKTADKIQPRKNTITITNGVCRCLIYEDDYQSWQEKGWVSSEQLKREAEAKVRTLKGVV